MKYKSLCAVIATVVGLFFSLSAVNATERYYDSYGRYQGKRMTTDAFMTNSEGIKDVWIPIPDVSTTTPDDIKGKSLRKGEPTTTREDIREKLMKTGECMTTEVYTKVELIPTPVVPMISQEDTKERLKRPLDLFFC